MRALTAARIGLHASTAPRGRDAIYRPLPFPAPFLAGAVASRGPEPCGSCGRFVDSCLASFAAVVPTPDLPAGSQSPAPPSPAAWPSRPRVSLARQAEAKRRGLRQWEQLSGLLVRRRSTRGSLPGGVARCRGGQDPSVPRAPSLPLPELARDSASSLLVPAADRWRQAYAAVAADPKSAPLLCVAAGARASCAVPRLL
eukprot:scaffold5766_cov256-Pinguiococcus_pyrenoidosus.AAC.1